MRVDARELPDIFEKGEVQKIYLNFSDPWPKARHAKRRLTSREFLARYEEILIPEGVVEFKTDNRELFEFSLEEVKMAPLANLFLPLIGVGDVYYKGKKREAISLDLGG